MVCHRELEISYNGKANTSYCSDCETEFVTVFIDETIGKVCLEYVYCPVCGKKIEDEKKERLK